MADDKLGNLSMNDIFTTTVTGPVDNKIGNIFLGINHRHIPTQIPVNRDRFGLVFFTRPQLNLSKSNTRVERKFIPLLTTEAASIQRIIRLYLDPRLEYEANQLSCPFVDKNQAFMPLLTNHINTLSGWPDIVIDTYSSKPGAYRESYSFTDSISDIYSVFQLTAEFRNMLGSPIPLLFYVWLLYQSNVYMGKMIPYLDYLMNNTIDYNTRVYRLVLDKNNKYVQSIACTGASFPISNPMGKMFDFDIDKPFNLSMNEVQINLQCMGAYYNDPIIIFCFNHTVETFNASMRDNYRDSVMMKIPYEDLVIMNNKKCYPRVNPDSYELEWWIPKGDYLTIKNNYDTISSALLP